MKLLVSAIEPSANLHLKYLLKELPHDIEFIGIFDPKLSNSQPIYDMSQNAIMGFIEVFKQYRFLKALNDQMAQMAGDVDKVLLMDSSGFNLPLAKKIKQLYPQKEVIYYILPQAWAWRKGRIKTIETVCDKLCSILPFEQDFYTKKEKITYVGHPLLDEIETYNDFSTKNAVAFMPGSRKSEISNLMPIYSQIAHNIGDKRCYLIIPPNFKDKTEEELLALYGDTSQFTLAYSTHETLPNVDFAFICSGTATLEAAIIGTPFVLAYIAKPLDYFIAKNLVKMKYIGLANIFFEKSNLEVEYGHFHQEFIQNDVSLENLLAAYRNYDIEAFKQKSSLLKEYLSNGSSKNTAQIILGEF
jgi:lipid-A-disaccharide synthase